MGAISRTPRERRSPTVGPPAADPSRRWEVINAGGISYASYREAKLVEEIARYQPDLVLVYSGHNEFLEERTYRKAAAIPIPTSHRPSRT